MIFLVHKKQSFKCVILEEIINTSPSRSVALYACEWAQWRGTVKDSWEKMAWKFSTSWSKIQQEESLNSGICFMLLSLCSESHVDLKWAEMCQHVLLQNSPPRQAKNLETAHWRQMHSLPFASFANWQLFCKAAATLTRIPNACLHWRDHINVNDVWYTDVSHIQIYHTQTDVLYTDVLHTKMYHTQNQRTKKHARLWLKTKSTKNHKNIREKGLCLFTTNHSTQC